MRTKLAMTLTQARQLIEKLAYDDGYRLAVVTHPDEELRKAGINMDFSVDHVELPSKPVLRALLKQSFGNGRLDDPPPEGDDDSGDLFNLFIFTGSRSAKTATAR